MNVGVLVGVSSAAVVEFLETAAIAYAIARAGYHREAYWGTISGLAIVGLGSALFGKGLQLVPLQLLQIVIGLSLLWFGWGWVKKSTLRQIQHKRAGWIIDPLKSEHIVLENKSAGFSKLNFFLMTKSAALEALEVAIVVVTLGLASHAWKEAIVGTLLSLILTIALVYLLHGYLVKIPEVLIKLAAGILLMAFGSFWLGEGIGIAWPDLTLLLLVFLYGLLCFLFIRWKTVA